MHGRHRFFIALSILFFAAAAPAIEPGKTPVPPFPDEPADVLRLPKPPETTPLPRQTDSAKNYVVIKVVSSRETAAESAAIGFFNHSERDLILEINGRTVKLERHYYLQLKLPRAFTWREKEGTEQTTQVPEAADGVEIVFRK